MWQTRCSNRDEISVLPAGRAHAGHGRMLHSAGIHRGSSIRFAVPADFQQDRPTIVPPSGRCPAGHAAGGHRTYPDDTPPEMVKQYGMEWHKVRAALVLTRAYLFMRPLAIAVVLSRARRPVRPFADCHCTGTADLPTGHGDVCGGLAATGRHVGILGDLI